MIGYIRDTELSEILMVPISLPQTEIRSLGGPGDSLVVSSVRLDSNQLLRLKWLELTVSKISGAGPTTKTNDAYGFVYCGLYSGGFDHLNRPSGKPLVALNLDTPGTLGVNPRDRFDFSSPDLYTIMVVNNLLGYNVEATVTGSWRLYL
jgi:hypothetical protein